MLIVHYNEDRLILRELSNVVSIPKEFQAWEPSIDIIESLVGGRATIQANGYAPSRLIIAQKSLHLDPKNGQITIFQRYRIFFCIFTKKTN